MLLLVIGLRNLESHSQPVRDNGETNCYWLSNVFFLPAARICFVGDMIQDCLTLRVFSGWPKQCLSFHRHLIENHCEDEERGRKTKNVWLLPLKLFPTLIWISSFSYKTVQPQNRFYKFGTVPIYHFSRFLSSCHFSEYPRVDFTISAILFS